MKVNKEKVVQVHYRLYKGEGTDDLVEETYDGEPMEYIQGMGLLIPAFESHLLGKDVGESFDFVIPVQDAYGQVNPDLQMTLPKETFFVDGKFDEEMVYVGALLPMLTDDGQQVEGEVVDVWDEGVDMDFNHPLAGQTLHFVGEVVDVRDATAKDLETYLGNDDCHDHDHCHCGDDQHDCNHGHKH